MTDFVLRSLAVAIALLFSSEPFRAEDQVADLPGEGYVDRYSEAMKFLLGARSGEPLHELAPELLATVVLEDDRPEFHAPMGQRDWCTGRILQAADATHFAQVEVFNPVSSNLVSVVSGVRVYAAGAAVGQEVFLILDGTASGGVILKPFLLDTRFGLAGTVNPVTQAFAGRPDLAIGAQVILDANTLPSATGSVLFAPTDGKVIATLFPGRRVKAEVNLVGAGVSIIAIFWGYERQMVPGEDKVR